MTANRTLPRRRRTLRTDKEKGIAQRSSLCNRHGLRAAELCSLRWAQIDLRHGRLHVNRAEGGQESVHLLHGPELRAHHCLVLANGSAHRTSCKASLPCASTHAAALYRVQARQRWPRHALAGALSGAQFAINSAIHGAGA